MIFWHRPALPDVIIQLAYEQKMFVLKYEISSNSR
jgi:hypothetical protein